MSTEPWSWYSKRSGKHWEGNLRLYWEADEDPISDNFSPEEMSAMELFNQWIELLEARNDNDGWLKIHWFVRARSTKMSTIEFAPILPSSSEESFLSYFTWPVNANTGEPVNWLRVPVADKLWRSGHADKGGFVQEVTGWKPGALQDRVWLDLLKAAAERRGD